MRTKNFTPIFAIVLFLIAGMNGHAADDTRHLIVMNLDSVQIASFSLKNSEAPVLNGNKVDIKNTWDNEMYSYDADKTLFTFGMRSEGSATGTEMITIEKWNVSYFSGSLHFSKPVNRVRIYSFSGVLIDSPSGDGTDFATFLPSDKYIVATDKGSLKLNVNTNLSGGASAEIQTKTISASNPHPALRSGVSTYSDSDAEYWNVSGTSPFLMSEIKVFKFSDNSVVVALNNGTTAELDYQGSTYDLEPVVVAENEYDEYLTFLYGGWSYVWNDGEPILACSAVKQNGDIVYKIKNEIIIVKASQITNPQMWASKSQVGSRLSIFITTDGYCKGMTYYAIGNTPYEQNVPLIYLIKADEGGFIIDSIFHWSYNGNTNLVPTQIVKTGNNFVMKCVDYRGIPYNAAF